MARTTSVGGVSVGEVKKSFGEKDITDVVNKKARVFKRVGTLMLTGKQFSSISNDPFSVQNLMNEEYNS